MLVVGVNESTCEPFKRSLTLSLRPLDLLNVSLVGFRSQPLWGSLFPLQISGAGEPDVGHKPLAPQEDTGFVIFLPIAGPCTVGGWGGVLGVWWEHI